MCRLQGSSSTGLSLCLSGFQRGAPAALGFEGWVLGLFRESTGGTESACGRQAPAPTFFLANPSRFSL
jgi:hypothetical protein